MFLNVFVSQNIFRSSITRYIARSWIASSALPDSTLLNNLRLAPSSKDLLGTVKDNINSMDHTHMIQALKSIYELQRNKETGLKTVELLKDPTFSVLCHKFNKDAKSFDSRVIIEGINMLSLLSVPTETELVQSLLWIIRKNINKLNIKQIINLDFILGRLDFRNSLVDTLQFALPLAFQIHVPIDLEYVDFVFLIEMLNYSSHRDVPDRYVNNIVTAILLNDQNIDVHLAKRIIRSLAAVSCAEEEFPSRFQLLTMCCESVIKGINELSYDDVLRITTILNSRVVKKRIEFYHEELLDEIASYAVRNDVGFAKALTISRLLSRITHTHLGLIEYLCTKAVSDPTVLENAKVSVLFGFVNCLSSNNFTPDRPIWQNIQKYMFANPTLCHMNYALPWGKFCLELASLGVYEDSILGRVFSKEFLDNYLPSARALDEFQLMTLHDAVRAFHSSDYALPDEWLKRVRENYPTHKSKDVEEHLAKAFGGREYLLKNVALPGGVVADFLLCMKNGVPQKLPQNDKPKIIFKELQLPEGSLTVGLQLFGRGCFSANGGRLRGVFRLSLALLERDGCIAAPLDFTRFRRCRPYERGPFLLRSLNEACGQYGLNITARA